MKNNVMQEASDKVKSLANLKSTSEYTELEQLHQEGITPVKAYELTGSIKGRANIVSRIRELLENAEKEVVICTSVLDFEDKSRAIIPAIEKLNQNNIKVKIALSGEEDKIKKLNTKHNLKAKYSESQSRMFIADKKEVLFMVTPEKSEEEIAVWLNSPFFTSSLAGLFEQSLKA